MKKRLFLIVLILHSPIILFAQNRKELKEELSYLKQQVATQDRLISTLKIKLDGKEREVDSLHATYYRNIADKNIEIRKLKTDFDLLSKEFSAYNTTAIKSKASNVSKPAKTSSPPTKTTGVFSESSSYTKNYGSSRKSYSPSKSSGYSGGTVHVKGYYRKDGTYVRPHTRRAPRRR